MPFCTIISMFIFVAFLLNATEMMLEQIKRLSFENSIWNLSEKNKKTKLPLFIWLLNFFSVTNQLFLFPILKNRKQRKTQNQESYYDEDWCDLMPFCTIISMFIFVAFLLNATEMMLEQIKRLSFENSIWNLSEKNKKTKLPLFIWLLNISEEYLTFWKYLSLIIIFV